MLTCWASQLALALGIVLAASAATSCGSDSQVPNELSDAASTTVVEQDAPTTAGLEENSASASVAPAGIEDEIEAFFNRCFDNNNDPLLPCVDQRALIERSAESLGQECGEAMISVLSDRMTDVSGWMEREARRAWNRGHIGYNPVSDGELTLEDVAPEEFVNASNEATLSGEIPYEQIMLTGLLYFHEFGVFLIDSAQAGVSEDCRFRDEPYRPWELEVREFLDLG